MSTLVTSNISDGTTSVGTGYVVNGSAKAWSNLNGNGTIALRDSLNISGVTDNGTGDYTYSFSTSMANANYTFTGTGEFAAGTLCTEDDTGRLSTAYQTRHFNTSGTLQDCAVTKTIVMGDLA